MHRSIKKLLRNIIHYALAQIVFITLFLVPVKGKFLEIGVLKAIWLMRRIVGNEVFYS